MTRHCISMICLLGLSASATGGLVTSIDINATNFTIADPTVTFNVDGSATMSEDALLFAVVLANDPGNLGSPSPTVIQPCLNVSLMFDYVFSEGVGSDDQFTAFLFDATSGTPLGPATEFTTQASSAGTVSWDLSPYVGQTLGLEFQLLSDINFSGTDLINSTVTLSNLQAVPEPSPVLLLLSAALIIRLAPRC